MCKILILLFFLLLSLNNFSYEVEINAGILIGDGYDDISFSIAYNLLLRSGIITDVIKVSRKFERKAIDIRVLSETEMSVRADYHFATVPLTLL